MKNVITIIYVAPLSGVSKRGNSYDMRLAQCIVEKTDENGAPTPLVGELVLPEKFKETTPGRYEVEFELVVDRDKRIGARVLDMKALPRDARPAASPAPSTAKA